MNQYKSIILFIFLTLLFVLIVLVNFFQAFLTDRYLSGLPSFIIPLISIIILLLITARFCAWATENDRIKYEFITVVTHKFRTPITGLKWAINALRKDMTIQEKDDLLNKMEATNGRLMEIVDLLVGSVKFDKKLEYAYEATSLRELIDKSLERYAEQFRQKNITFNIDSGQGMPLVIIDRRKIQFVIDMLIDNAIKYTPEGGKIDISLSSDKEGSILSVRDSGIGLEPSEIKQIFRRFWRGDRARTVDTEGMGLGLYTVKIIVQKHGGRIWVESEGRDKGSTFFVKLNNN